MAAWSLASILCGDKAVGWGLWKGEAEIAQGSRALRGLFKSVPSFHAVWCSESRAVKWCG